MPPRIHSCLPLQQSSHHSASCSQAQNGRILLPLLSLKSQSRPASILSSLSDNPSAYHKQLRRGRGPSSGKGKTSGRGHKGQRQHGKVPRGFEGGQTPIEIVHGKRGFKNAYELQSSHHSKLHLVACLPCTDQSLIQLLRKPSNPPPVPNPILDLPTPHRPLPSHHDPGTRPL